ncbi:ATP-dependent protease ATPase subunit HslU [Planctomycetales bacterium ZRK34]|nr:ATP-dependent protease ATPase subunit HslU [Planctomycetales bacterium ZRK34]
MEHLTPKQIVAELDRFIIGQNAAKKAVAVAIRNRWRRQQLDPDLAREVNPKNIIMVGPTGVGKTEIARRIASLTGAPFVKVEASKFTEVGYHGRDVESMVRDLLEHGIKLVRAEHAETVREKAEAAVEQRLVDLLLPDSRDPEPAPASASTSTSDTPAAEGGMISTDDSVERRQKVREVLLKQLRDGKHEDRTIEITLHNKAVPVTMFSNMGLDQMDPQMSKMFENLIPEQTKRMRVTIAEARQILIDQETEAMIDQDKMTTDAIDRTEQAGIIFIDEVDKIATGDGAGSGGRGPDVSRQGVQRDLLPIVEGSTVSTRHGMVNTDHILFIAAGAFHSAAVSDLMPELQGRFPIRVELDALTRDDFVRILTEPSNALTKQQQALLKTEGIDVGFEPDAIDAMAELAAQANQQMENIGARRLMTIVERLFEQINFDAPDLAADGQTTLTIDSEHVRKTLADIVQNEDLSRFVL